MKLMEKRPSVLRFNKNITFERLETLQVNVGNLCNNTCRHCHINAGPNGKNTMHKDTILKILKFLKDNPQITLDITGGAPEMNPYIQFFIKEAAARNKVILRTNLTILADEKYAHMPQFFKGNKVTLIASLPCYTSQNVETQRGLGTFQASIDILRRLNALGYGTQKDLELNLVYNPLGTYLPPLQQDLENDYKKRLKQDYKVVFNKLLTITNMPLGRFETSLKLNKTYDKYMNFLKSNFREENLNSVMCKTLISVDYSGKLYNCDFNQVCDMSILNSKGFPLTVDNLLEISRKRIKVRTGPHCYGCTAGNGSSCGGALI